jgi:hypothetical protein
MKYLFLTLMLGCSSMSYQATYDTYMVSKYNGMSFTATTPTYRFSTSVFTGKQHEVKSVRTQDFGLSATVHYTFPIQELTLGMGGGVRAIAEWSTESINILGTNTRLPDLDLQAYPYVSAIVMVTYHFITLGWGVRYPIDIVLRGGICW